MLFQMFLLVSLLVGVVAFAALLARKRAKAAFAMLGIYAVFIGLLLFAPPLCFGLLLAPPLFIGMGLLVKKRSLAGCVVTGVSVMLIGAFLFDAETDKRSGPGRCVRWLNGEYGNLQGVNDLAEDAMKSVDPLELQKWAVSVLQESQPTNAFGGIPNDKIPTSIRNLNGENYSFGDAWIDSTSDVSPQSRFIMLEWGGGFLGRWGIRVGSLACTGTNDDDYYYREWKPGICFWCETR